MFWVSKFLGFNVRGVLSKERNWKLRNKKKSNNVKFVTYATQKKQMANKNKSFYLILLLVQIKSVHRIMIYLSSCVSWIFVSFSFQLSSCELNLFAKQKIKQLMYN
jgi:hypothetical protein